MKRIISTALFMISGLFAATYDTDTETPEFKIIYLHDASNARVLISTSVYFKGVCFHTHRPGANKNYISNLLEFNSDVSPSLQETISNFFSNAKNEAQKYIDWFDGIEEFDKNQFRNAYLWTYLNKNYTIVAKHKQAE